MGISSSSQKVTPVYDKQLLGANTNVTKAYDSQAPKITAITDQLATNAAGLQKSFTDGDPNVQAASQFNQDVLHGKYMGANPYLDSQIGHANNDIRNQAEAAGGRSGNWGNSSALADITSRNIGNNEATMRGNAYNTGLGLMGQQSALAPGIAEARYQPLDQMNNIAQAQSIPLQAASGMASSTGGLLGQYTNTRGTQGWGGALAGMAGAGLSGWASGGFKTSDIRAKEDIRAVGKTDGGLTIYAYRYIGQPEIHFGPMAQEVAAKQPENLGPTVGGYMTVNMAGVR